MSNEKCAFFTSHNLPCFYNWQSCYDLCHLLFILEINQQPVKWKSTLLCSQECRKVIFSSFLFIQSLQTCLMIAIQFKCKWAFFFFFFFLSFIFSSSFSHFFTLFYWFDFPGHLLALFKAASRYLLSDLFREMDFLVLVEIFYFHYYWTLVWHVFFTSIWNFKVFNFVFFDYPPIFLIQKSYI